MQITKNNIIFAQILEKCYILTKISWKNANQKNRHPYRTLLQHHKQSVTFNRNKQLKVNEIFDLIPSELNSQNKRFIFKSLKESARFDASESNFLWLKNADMALPVYNVDIPITLLSMPLYI